VYFIYPETANVRLEDMNSLFGDATTQAATPQQIAEAESLFSGSGRDGRGPGLAAEAAIPGLDIEPPDLENGRSPPKSENGEGVGGWISNMVKRTKGDGDSASGKYKRVGQDED
jgi:hypothetical protein